MFRIISSSKFRELENSKRAAEEKVTETFSLLETQRGLAGAMLKSMTEGVLAVDRKEKIILANQAIEKIFNLTEPEMLGRTVRESLRNNEIADLIKKAMAADSPITEEIEIVTPIQGSFVVSASPIQGRAGTVCVLHDITELRKLEKYRSEFVANVSHELKTPLTAIRNYVETLINGGLEDKQHNVDFLNKIDKHAINLSALIDDILEISRLEQKKELGPFTKVDISKVINRAIETITPKARKKKISMVKEGVAGGLLISGIEEHIYRAILNLLDNAVNYTGEGGEMKILCARKNGQIEVAVTDTGIGIPEEHLERIFERFYRVDRARSRELGGTGLGLAIVKHVMNIHNGNVLVESEVGRGSKFSLNFPL